MRHRYGVVVACVIGVLGLAFPTRAAVLTFDELITGETSHAFDADGNGVVDAIFSTLDPGGFNTVGPGTNVLYIVEPGLEGTSLLDTDLRADFPLGAVGLVRFGFALNDLTEGPNTQASVSIFGASGQLLASRTLPGLFTKPDGVNPSDFPEGLMEVAFVGTAAYALFDFRAGFDRYILDNFTFTPVPEPTSVVLLGLGLSGVHAARRRSSARSQGPASSRPDQSLRS